MDLHPVSVHWARLTDTYLFYVRTVKFDEIEQSRAAILSFSIEFGSISSPPLHISTLVSVHVLACRIIHLTVA